MLGFVMDNVSFSGRASRLDYWLLTLLGPVVLAVIAIAAVTVLGKLGLMLALLLILIFLVVSLGLHVRRLHDRDMSAHWLWIFWGLPALLQGAGSVIRHPSAHVFCAVAGAAIGLWCLVELGFLRGTEGPNPYGDDPAR